MDWRACAFLVHSELFLDRRLTSRLRTERFGYLGTGRWEGAWGLELDFLERCSLRPLRRHCSCMRLQGDSFASDVGRSAVSHAAETRNGGYLLRRNRDRVLGLDLYCGGFSFEPCYGLNRVEGGVRQSLSMMFEYVQRRPFSSMTMRVRDRRSPDVVSAEAEGDDALAQLTHQSTRGSKHS